MIVVIIIISIIIIGISRVIIIIVIVTNIIVIFFCAMSPLTSFKYTQINKTFQNLRQISDLFGKEDRKPQNSSPVSLENCFSYDYVCSDITQNDTVTVLQNDLYLPYLLRYHKISLSACLRLSRTHSSKPQLWMSRTFLLQASTSP